MKICCHCKKSKDDNEFAFRDKVRGTRASKCKECQCGYAKTHYCKNKSSYILKSGLYRKHEAEINQRCLFDYLRDKKCVDCGIRDVRVLEFDHRNPSEKKNGIAKMLRQGSWKRMLAEIEKCDIRCANCHRIKTSEQFSYFRSNLLRNERGLV